MSSQPVTSLIHSFNDSLMLSLLRGSLILSLFFSFALRAQFVPIPLAPDSFNQDIVVERTAPRPVMPATTASMEVGLANTGSSWFEKGYCADWPATGLPYAGSTITSDLTMDHDYQFAPDYRSNNAVLVDSTLTHAELVLGTPAPFAGLSFLLSGGHDSASAPVAYTIHHQDGSTQTGTVRCLDWLNNTYSTYSANGRVNVTTFTFLNINAQVPKLFSTDVVVTNAISPVVSVELDYVSGTGHSAVFALSGAVEAGGAFSPVGFSGYNADMVVEASAGRPQFLSGITSATMEAGAVNSLRTFYERGYVPGAPLTGLPAAGSLVTNVVAPDVVYVMAPDYAGNNAVLLDGDLPSANLTPLNPGVWGALSFLTASASGPVTNECVVRHADGTAETNQVVSPDWNDAVAAPALVVNGRVNVNNRMLDSVNESAPRLFASEVVLANSVSAMTNIVVNWGGPGSGSHAVIFAVSGSSGGSAPSPARLTIRWEPGGVVVIASSAPGRLEYATALEGENTVWQSAGSFSGEVRVTVESGARFFRVVR